MDSVLPKILSFSKNPLHILNVSLVCKSFHKISIDDNIWQQFNVCGSQHTYQHFLEARKLFSSLERLLWTNPSSEWANILWDADCAPDSIQQWHPYTQLRLVTSRYRYDIFAKQVTNKEVIRLAINVPLSYQHYAAFEDRELLLLSIKNRIPEKQLREIFSEYDDDYEIQMAVASFHGDYFTEFQHGQRELLLAALSTAPTRTPTSLIGAQVDDLELLEATLQVWDTWSLSFRPSKRLLEDPTASLLMAELCGVSLLNSYDPRRALDRELVLAHLRRRPLRGMRPNIQGNNLVRFNAITDRSGAYQVELLAIDERLVEFLNVADQPEILEMAMRRNPNVYLHHPNKAEAIAVAARYSYSLALEQYYAQQALAERNLPTLPIDWESVLATQPRQYGRQQPQRVLFYETAQRSDYGPCQFRNRVASTRSEHARLSEDQALVPICKARAMLKNRKMESFSSVSAKQTILSLPPDSFRRIIDQTNPSPEDLMRISRVCRYFRKHCLDPRSWAWYRKRTHCFKYGEWSVDPDYNKIGTAYHSLDPEYFRKHHEIKNDYFAYPQPPPAPYIYASPNCLTQTTKSKYTANAYGLIDIVHMDGIIMSWFYHNTVPPQPYDGYRIDKLLFGTNPDSELLWSDVGAAQVLYDQIKVPLDFCLSLLKGRIRGHHINADYLMVILLQKWPWVIDFSLKEDILWEFTNATGLVVPHTPYSREMAIHALSRKPSVLPTFIQGHIVDKDVLILAAGCKTRDNVYACIDPILLKDRAFMIEFFGASGWQIRYSGAERSDEEYVITAFKSFCDKRLLGMVQLRSKRVALAAIAYDARLYWEFGYRDPEFTQLAMATNCNLWDSLKSKELAPIAAAQDYRCWHEVNKLFSIPEPRIRRLNGYRCIVPELPIPRRRLMIWKCIHLPSCIRREAIRELVWERFTRFAEYRVGLESCQCTPRPLSRYTINIPC